MPSSRSRLIVDNISGHHYGQQRHQRLLELSEGSCYERRLRVVQYELRHQYQKYSFRSKLNSTTRRCDVHHYRLAQILPRIRLHQAWLLRALRMLVSLLESRGFLSTGLECDERTA
jgi:hypothetical protein